MNEWAELAKTFGVPLALVIFFVIQGKYREDRMARRIDVVSDYQRDQMGEMIQDLAALHAKTVTALEHNSAALSEVNKTMILCEVKRSAG